MDPSPRASDDALIGRTIAEKFRIDAFVGRGAMGAVYKATHLHLKKKVAIKVMNPDRPADGAYAARFKREAKAASRMDHPNSLRVLDVGEDEGLLYIAMEFLEGRDLFRVLKEEFPLTKERIISILSQALAALAVAHEMGVIHRDLKPENIMLLPAKDDEGKEVELVKVCDFGIAKILDKSNDLPEDGATKTQTHTGTLTAHGMLIGTPEYMSPEQARGEPADARSDIYSTGVILFQLLTGRLPFIANSKIRLVIKHVEEVPPNPREIDSRIDLALEAICMKALQKRPEDRFQSAREMRTALKDALEGTYPSVKMKLPSSVPPPKRESTRASVPPPPASVSPVPAAVGDATQSGAQTMPTLGARTSSAEQLIVRDSRKITAADPMVPTHSTEATIDPEEAALAIKEARERLSGRPPGGTSGERPAAAQPETRTNPMTIAIAVVVTAIVVAALMMLTR